MMVGECAGVADHRVGGARHDEEEVLLRFDRGVVDEGYPDGLDGLAGGEGEAAAGAGVVQSVGCGAVGGAVIDCHRGGGYSIEANRERREAVALAYDQIIDRDCVRWHFSFSPYILLPLANIE
jgi:hypothetical protein